MKEGRMHEKYKWCDDADWKKTEAALLKIDEAARFKIADALLLGEWGRAHDEPLESNNIQVVAAIGMLINRAVEDAMGVRADKDFGDGGVNNEEAVAAYLKSIRAMVERHLPDFRRRQALAEAVAQMKAVGLDDAKIKAVLKITDVMHQGDDFASLLEGPKTS
jgi:hypothetical protein